jgi:hypothetical protein
MKTPFILATLIAGVIVGTAGAIMRFPVVTPAKSTLQPIIISIEELQARMDATPVPKLGIDSSIEIEE